MVILIDDYSEEYHIAINLCRAAAKLWRCGLRDDAYRAFDESLRVISSLNKPRELEGYIKLALEWFGKVGADNLIDRLHRFIVDHMDRCSRQAYFRVLRDIFVYKFRKLLSEGDTAKAIDFLDEIFDKYGDFNI